MFHASADRFGVEEPGRVCKRAAERRSSLGSEVFLGRPDLDSHPALPRYPPPARSPRPWSALRDRITARALVKVRAILDVTVERRREATLFAAGATGE